MRRDLHPVLLRMFNSSVGPVQLRSGASARRAPAWAALRRSQFAAHGSAVMRLCSGSWPVWMPWQRNWALA